MSKDLIRDMLDRASELISEGKTVVEWFDPKSSEHLAAYQTYIQTKSWPDGFIPENVTLTPDWRTQLAKKLLEADAPHIQDGVWKDREDGSTVQVIDSSEDILTVKNEAGNTWKIDLEDLLSRFDHVVECKIPSKDDNDAETIKKLTEEHLLEKEHNMLESKINERTTPKIGDSVQIKDKEGNTTIVPHATVSDVDYTEPAHTFTIQVEGDDDWYDSSEYSIRVLESKVHEDGNSSIQDLKKSQKSKPNESKINEAPLDADEPEVGGIKDPGFTGKGEVPGGEEEEAPLGDLDVDDEHDVVEADFDKIYLGQDDTTHYYVIAKKNEEGQTEDLQITDQEGKELFSAEKNGIDTRDVGKFILAALNDEKVKIRELERDVVIQYLVPEKEEELDLEDEEEEEEEEEGGGSEEEETSSKEGGETPEMQNYDQERPMESRKSVNELFGLSFGKNYFIPNSSDGRRGDAPRIQAALQRAQKAGLIKSFKSSNAGFSVQGVKDMSAVNHLLPMGVSLMRESKKVSETLHSASDIKYAKNRVKKLKDLKKNNPKAFSREDAEVLKRYQNKLRQWAIQGERVKDESKKLSETLKVKDGKGNTFSVQIVDEGSKDIVVQVNNREFRFKPDFAALYEMEGNKLTETGLQDMVTELLSHLRQDEYAEVVGSGVQEAQLDPSVTKQVKTDVIFQRVEQLRSKKDRTPEDEDTLRQLEDELKTRGDGQTECKIPDKDDDDAETIKKLTEGDLDDNYPPDLDDEITEEEDGLARKAGKKPGDFSEEQLAAGTKVEMEHTNNQSKAQQIAMDHLTEDPRYYVKLKKLEGKMNEGEFSDLADIQTKTVFKVDFVLDSGEKKSTRVMAKDKFEAEQMMKRQKGVKSVTGSSPVSGPKESKDSLEEDAHAPNKSKRGVVWSDWKDFSGFVDSLLRVLEEEFGLHATSPSTGSDDMIVLISDEPIPEMSTGEIQKWADPDEYGDSDKDEEETEEPEPEVEESKKITEDAGTQNYHKKLWEFLDAPWQEDNEIELVNLISQYRNDFKVSKPAPIQDYLKRLVDENEIMGRQGFSDSFLNSLQDLMGTSPNMPSAGAEKKMESKEHKKPSHINEGLVLEDIERFEEIMQEIQNLSEEAFNIVRSSGDRDLYNRVKAYWRGHIQTAVGLESEYMGKSMHSMKDTLEDLKELKTEYEAEEESEYEDQQYEEEYGDENEDMEESKGRLKGTRINETLDAETDKLWDDLVAKFEDTDSKWEDVITFIAEVWNGGFSQWVENGYAEEDGVSVKKMLGKLNTDAAKKTIGLIDQIMAIADEIQNEDAENWNEDEEKITDEFYAGLDNQLVKDMAAKLGVGAQATKEVGESRKNSKPRRRNPKSADEREMKESVKLARNLLGLKEKVKEDDPIKVGDKIQIVDAHDYRVEVEEAIVHAIDEEKGVEITGSKVPVSQEWYKGPYWFISKL